MTIAIARQADLSAVYYALLYCLSVFFQNYLHGRAASLNNLFFVALYWRGDAVMLLLLLPYDSDASYSCYLFVYLAQHDTGKLSMIKNITNK